MVHIRQENFIILKCFQTFIFHVFGIIAEIGSCSSIVTSEIGVMKSGVSRVKERNHKISKILGDFEPILNFAVTFKKEVSKSSTPKNNHQ